MSDWTPMVVLPNTHLRDAIEMPDIILVPVTDERVRAYNRQQPRLRQFLNRFRDAFGDKIDVSVLMVRENAPEKYRSTGPIAAFRDAVAVSSLLAGRAILMTHESRMRKPIWSECFIFYPWMLGRDGEGLYASTQTMQGTQSLDLFKGQPTPGFGSEYIDRADVDGPLLSALATRWQDCFSVDEPSWENRAIFRSLNMAYHACMTPGGQETQHYDVGRLLVLWASAMEILVHTGPSGNSTGSSGKQQVMDMLEEVDWYDERLTAPIYEVSMGRGMTHRRTLPALLYSRVDALRNKFIHGNPVTHDDLVTDSGAHYLHLAAVLYRECLAGKLRIRRPVFAGDDKPQEFDQDRFLEDFERYVEWKNPRTRFERAIFAAAGMPETEI
jgi:hypothetical protein